MSKVHLKYVIAMPGELGLDSEPSTTSLRKFNDISPTE
jgi:hypothetical protein